MNPNKTLKLNIHTIYLLIKTKKKTLLELIKKITKLRILD